VIVGGVPMSHPVTTGPSITITHGMHAMGLPGRWWDDSHTAKSIGLTSDQQKRMDGIFDSSRATLVQRYQSLQTEQQKLNAMPSKDLKDEDKVNAAIDRVTQARANLERASTQIYAQIRSVLSNSQQARLDDAISRQK